MNTRDRVRVRLGPAPTEAQRRHPLATLDGVRLVGLMIAADGHWRPLTASCRDALRRAVSTVELPADIPGDGVLVELPALPDGTHPATARALTRRGLVADGRVTLLGLQVVQYGDWSRPRTGRAP